MVSRGKFSYLEDHVDAAGNVKSEWKDEHVGFVNMIATNVPKLGLAHPISQSELCLCVCVCVCVCMDMLCVCVCLSPIELILQVVLFCFVFFKALN